MRLYIILTVLLFSSFNQATDAKFDINVISPSESSSPILAYAKEQRNRTSVMCVLKIMEKYFQSKQTYEQSTVLIDIEVRNPSNYLDAVFKILQTNILNTSMSFIIKAAHKKPVIRETISPKISNYLLMVNFTEEATDALR